MENILKRKDKKRKICILAPTIYSLFDKNCKVKFGGADVQLYLLSKEFSKNKNLDVNIITGDLNLKRNCVKYIHNITLHILLPLENKRIVLIKYYLQIFIYLVRISPDIIIQRGAGMETAICTFYCKLFRKKFIFSIASDNDVRYNRRLGIYRCFYQYTLKHMAYIIAQKKEQVKLLERWKQRKIQNIKVINSGYIISEVNNAKKREILWVGRAIPLKQPELFFSLARNFPNKSFIMICLKSFNLAYWKEIKESAKKIPNLQFIKKVPFDEIDGFFKNAKVFINTSIHEGFPNTYIQALKNNTPVIGLNVDPDNFLTINKCGFNCKGDVNKMKDYLSQLLTNKDLFAQYSKNSYEYVKENHDIQRSSKQWIEVIQNIR